MTITNTTIKSSASGDGSTSSFTYTFPINSTSELSVIIKASTGAETVKDITTHYTVADAGATGGTVTFTSGNIPASGETVVLFRNTTKNQTVDLIENDPFLAEGLENQFDNLQMQIQEVSEAVDRSFKVSKTNAITTSSITTSAADRANKILAFDASGNLDATANNNLDTLTEMTDVTLSSPADNEVLAYDSSSTHFINQTPAEAGLVSLTGSETLTNKTLTSPVINTSVSGTAVLDEDDMSSDSATKIATQQSIKAYVDAKKADMQFVLEDGDGTEVQIVKDSEVKFVEGGGIDINWTDTSTGSDADPFDLTFAIDSTVATLTGSQTLTNKTLTSPVLNTGVSGTAVKDEDNMASDSATHLATQQSIKAYVDAVTTSLNAQDLDVSDGSSAIAIDLDTETLGILGGTGLTSSASGNNVTLSVDAAQTQITSVGALDAGSITSGFGNIDNGSSTITTTGVITGGTVEATADTSAGDNAAIGYTAAEGLILTGQGSTSDITLKNDADAVVFTVPTGTDDILFPDNAKAIFGAGEDLQIYHDGTNSYIVDDGAGQLRIDTQGTDVRITKTNSEYMATFGIDGAVELYYDNSAKFATQSDGINVTGTVYADGLSMNDSQNIFLGNSADFRLYHDGSNSYIQDTGTGDLKIISDGNAISLQKGTSETMAFFDTDAGVGLYYDNAEKIATTASGIDITGGFAATAASTITSSSSGDLLTLKSTEGGAEAGPNLVLFRDSASPANDDVIGRMRFEGDDNEGNKTVYAQLTSQIIDKGSSGGEDSTFQMEVFNNGALRNIMHVKGATNGLPEVVFNDSSQDVNFRIESDGNEYMFYVDGGNNRVGIAGIADLGLGLHIKEGDSGVSSVSTDADQLVIENSAESGITLLAPTDSASRIAFGDSDNSKIGMIYYNHASNYMKFNVDDAEVMRMLDDENISIGTTDSHAKLTVMTASSGGGPNGDADELFLEGSGNAGMTIGSGTSSSGNIHFADVHAANRGILSYDHSADQMKFGVSGSIKARFTSSGEFMVGKSSSGIANAGVELFTDKLSATVSGATIMYLNRLTNDGTIAQFHQAGTEEGSIEVSGSTVSYNGFTGSHWSRLADNSKPSILRGTIMDSIDEMCDWYQAVAEVPEVLWSVDDPETQDTLWTENDNDTQDVLYTKEDELPEGVEVGDVKTPATKSVGDVKWSATATVGDIKEEAYTIKESIALGSKSVGDSITFTSNEKEYTGTIVKEDDVKHTKSKVSDTADSKKVYGVFSNWDDADDGLDGDVNDMNIAQVGTFIIRVNKDVTVESGDLLVSNGDGTAKLQDDDIIRSKTVAKVNSTVKIETYSDGSYTVPCTLHC